MSSIDARLRLIPPPGWVHRGSSLRRLAVADPPVAGNEKREPRHHREHEGRDAVDGWRLPERIGSNQKSSALTLPADPYTANRLWGVHRS
jgi:hypothetical protein